MFIHGSNCAAVNFRALLCLLRALLEFYVVVPQSFALSTTSVARVLRCGAAAFAVFHFRRKDVCS